MRFDPSTMVTTPDTGSVATEYAMLATLIAVAVVAAVMAIGLATAGNIAGVLPAFAH